jgi:uncharacterized protein (DUF488 family)
MHTNQSPRLYTIGVYGYNADDFFATLQDAQIDLFCDIRGRRGLRGATYAFANSRRLQARLAELGIRYVHRPDLAPSRALRTRQAEADRAAGIAKRQRTTLGTVFVESYRADVLAHLDSRTLLTELGPARRIVFFCVEREPAACHRSLLTTKLAQDLQLDLLHLMR